MARRFLIGALALASLPIIAACQDAGPSYSELPVASLDDILDPLRDRVRRQKTVFFGDSAWALGYDGRLYVSEDSGYGWTRVTLPDGGHLNTLQVEKGGSLAAVVTDKGILMRTEDAGETWTTIDVMAQVRDLVNPQYGGYFDQVAFDESLVDGVLIEFCQILRTADGGATWTAIADELQDKGSEERCVANAVHDAETGSWFAEVEIVGRMLTSGNYLFRSDDNGRAWKEICSLDEVGMLLKSIPSCFKLEGADDAMQAAVRVFVRDYWEPETEAQAAFSEQVDRGVYVARSLTIPKELRGAYDRVGLVEDATTGRVWSDNVERLAYTDDGGETWHVVLNGLPDAGELDFSLGQDRGFGVVHYQHLAVSGDLGKTWRLVNEEPRDIYDFEVLPDHDRVIVLTDRGLSIVDAETLEWRDVPGIGDAGSFVVAGPVVWVFTGSGDVHRSTDAGDNWNSLDVNLEQAELYVEAASCSTEHCLLEGYTSIGRLTAQPANLEIFDLSGQLPDPDEYYVVSTVLDAELDRGWTAMEDGRVYASSDAGRTWDEVVDLRDEIVEFIPAPGNRGFFALGYSNKYLWSADGERFESRRLPIDRDASVYGFCWVNDDVAILSAYNDEDDNFHLASTDGGATWGTVEPTSFDDTCRVPGGLIVFDSLIAGLK